MYLFVLRWTLGVLVLLPSVVNSRENCENHDNSTEHNSICVSTTGHDKPECLKNIIPCRSLYYVFENIKEQNSTVVYMELGNYPLNKSFTFWHVNHFAIIGLTSLYDVVIHCKKNAGLSFINSSEIIMKNIILSSCGAIQNSTSVIHEHSTKHQNFLTGLFLVNCINLSMDRVWISEAPGIGMQLYDVTGNVSISNSHFTKNGKNKQDSLETFPGGGFYFEFTYMGGLYPFKAPPKRIYQENGTFYFINVTFERNQAPKVAATIFDAGGYNHDAVGRGGGVSFFIKGSAQNNKFVFENCHFDGNSAKWGAGLFVEFQDNTKSNSLIFQSCHFNHNDASVGGGAIRIGLIAKHQRPQSSCVPNWVRFASCHFKYNKAIVGGGISLYGTTKQSGFHDQSSINLTHCVIEENWATIGSAFCSVLNTDQYGMGSSGNTLKISIANSIFGSNKIIYPKEEKVSGTGAIYAKGTPIILCNTTFIYNTKTALVLDSAYVQVFGNVSFINNTGQRGGAMSLYGTSKVIVSDQANLTFIENKCSAQGGAIYVRTPGPQLLAFNSTELMLHDCFFHFENDNNCSVSFYGNRGPTDTSGHSVYATTLQFCRRVNEDRVNNSALQTKSFCYYYANGTYKSDMVYEIVTDAVNIEVNGSDWNTTADKSFSPVVKLTDEKSNSVVGVINIQIISAENTVKLDPSSAYFLAKDNIKSLRINGQPKTRYGVSLVTVDSQLVFDNIFNAEIKGCEPGFHWKESKCQCDDPQNGMSRCDYDKQTLFLLKGYWGGYVQSGGTFVIVSCPENYCYCHKDFTSSGECLFERDKQCRGNREKQVCGRCKKGFSLKIGEDDCTRECNSGSLKWIGYLVAILLFLTLLVLFIMLINFDPFSAYLNAWLYSYQVLIFLIPGDIVSFDPFLTFIINLAHIQILGFGGVCMWSNMDDLQKLAFNYLLPVYFFICLCVLSKIVVQWPNNFFTRRLTQTSLARAFCTLFVLSYSTVINISLRILLPVKVGNEYFMYYQGDVGYFSFYHVIFAVFALLLVIFVGIFFPLLLIRRQWFRSFDKGLKKLLLDNFQRCFRDGYQWCAGYYFVCRFILLVVRLAAPRGAFQVSLLNSTCCIILAVFVLCQPYADNNGGTVIPYRILNISDAVLLCNLCLISSFGGTASGIYAHSHYKDFQTVILILSYIPLVFSFGLLAYVLRHRYITHSRLLEDVD